MDKVDDIVFIVTGAAGHLGSCVVAELLAQGKHVRAFILPNETCPDLAGKNRGLLRVYKGDICNPASLIRVFDDALPGGFIVIHCAGIISITKKEDRLVYDVNVGGTSNVIEACENYRAKRLVYVSSVHALAPLPVGQIIREVRSFDPDFVPGYYDKTKAIATQLVLDASKRGLDVVVVHPSGIIGPHGLQSGNMSRLISLYVRGKLPAAVHGGYDFVDVRDVANGIIAAAGMGKSGECYILSNRFVCLREMFDILSEVGSLRKLKLYLPLWIAKVFANFAEIYYRLTHKTPLFTRYSLKTLSGNAIYSHNKASRELNYSTRPLKETLTDTVTWVKKESLASQ